MKQNRLENKLIDLEKGEIPKDWEIKKLEEISEIVMGQSPPSSTYNVTGIGLPFFQGKADFGQMYPTPRKWCSQPKKIAYTGDILLSVRAPVGPTNIADRECCIGRGLAAIRTNPKKFNQQLLYRYFKLIESELSESGQGSTFTAIGGDEIRGIPVPTPPMQIQQKIIARLDAVFKEYSETKKQHEWAGQMLDLLPKAMLKNAFSGELIS